jgi:hypothetical protein
MMLLGNFELELSTVMERVRDHALKGNNHPIKRSNLSCIRRLYQKIVKLNFNMGIRW